MSAKASTQQHVDRFEFKIFALNFIVCDMCNCRLWKFSHMTTINHSKNYFFSTFLPSRTFISLPCAGKENFSTPFIVFTQSLFGIIYLDNVINDSWRNWTRGWSEVFTENFSWFFCKKFPFKIFSNFLLKSTKNSIQNRLKINEKNLIFLIYRHKTQSVRIQTSILTTHRYRIRTILMLLLPTVRMSRVVSVKMLRDQITFYFSQSSIQFIRSMWWVLFAFVLRTL